MTVSGEKSNLPLDVLGRTSRQIDHKSFELPVHHQLVSPLTDLKAKAEFRGFNLCLASAYRDFDQQLLIWNQKASGVRPVLDTNEVPLALPDLSPQERVFAILRWTALPGASRHHWGSDIDVYDARTLPDRDKLRLTQSETQKGGVFEKFYLWLNEILVDPASAFFRPYAEDRGGVAPEPWHLSYGPLSREMEKRLSIDILLSALDTCDIMYKKEIRANIEEIFHRFILNIS